MGDTQENKLVGLLTKDELLTQAAPFEEVEPIDIHLGEKVRFVQDLQHEISLVYNKREIQLEPSAIESLTSRIGMPKTYLKKIPKEQIPTLVLPHLNFWYSEQFADQTMRLLSINDRAIMVSPRTNNRYVKISEVVHAIERQLGKENVVGYHKPWLHNWENVEFSVVTPKTAEVKEGDPMNAGIRIQHNLLGTGPSRLTAYMFRQWCSNGAITMDNLDTWSSRNNEEDFSLWIQKSTREAGLVFNKEISRLKKLIEIPTNGNSADILTGVLEGSGVPQNLQTEVRNTFIDENVENLYDVYNILTRIGTHSEYFNEHPNSRGLLERVGANLSLHSKFCPTCHRQAR